MTVDEKRNGQPAPAVPMRETTVLSNVAGLLIGPAEETTSGGVRGWARSLHVLGECGETYTVRLVAAEPSGVGVTAFDDPVELLEESREQSARNYRAARRR